MRRSRRYKRGFDFESLRQGRGGRGLVGRRWRWVVVVVALVAIDGLVAVQKLDLGLGSKGAAPVTADEARGYGFSSSFDDLNAAGLDARMADIKAMGMTWVRFDVSWAEVRPRIGGAYDWSGPEAIVKAARAHDLTVLAIADLTPNWARVKGCANSTLCAPADPAAFGQFAGDAAAHFRKLGVNDWEVWNEPNISYRFRPAADPIAYTNMLMSAYSAIKKADPQALVVGGSLAPSATGNGSYTPADFVSAMYEARAAGWFDALSIHPYTYPKLPSETGPLDAWGQIPTLHNLMQLHGDGNKKVWITEFGAPTNGPNTTSDPSVSEDRQAAILTEAVTEFRKFPWSGPFLWYDYQDAGTATYTTENFYGLVRADGSHKPAYDALTAVMVAYP